MKQVHIALDFDRTLAYYYGGKSGISSVGKPIPRMVERLRVWLDKDYLVSIFTARVAPSGKSGSRSLEFIENQKRMIWNFLESVGSLNFRLQRLNTRTLLISLMTKQRR